MTELYAGIDLHSTNNVVVVCDQEGREVYRRRLRNDLESVAKALEPHRESLCGVVVESTYNWYWLVDGLEELGHTLYLANTGAIQKYSGLKHADDNSDARWLAEMLRLGILPVGHIYPREERGVRDLLRQRARLVRQRTAGLLSIKNILTRNRGCSPGANAIRKIEDGDVDGLLCDPNIALSVKACARVTRVLGEQIALVEKAVRGQVRLRDAYRNLLTVSGIGEVLAMTIMLETGDIGRFPTVGDFSSYARCVGSAHVSNGKRKGRGNTKNGNRYLGWAFVEAAVFAARHEPKIQRFYQRRRSGGSHPVVARAVVAHKLANACYHMLRNNTVFDVDRAFQ